MRSLNAERSRGAIVCVFLVGALLTAWGVWLVRSRIGVYAVSTAARLEAEGAIQPIQSLFTGRIATNNLVLGREVKRGDVLIELDTNVQSLQLLEEKVQGRSIESELETLKREIEAEEGASEQERSAAEIGVEEARAKLRESEAAVAYATMDAERKAKLHAEGLASQSDLARAQSDAQKLRSAVESVKLGIRRQQQEQLTRNSERRSRIEGLRRQINQLSGLKTKLGAVVNRIESEMQLRRITAPVDGRIGDAPNLRVGSVVSAGERLGAIVPAGTLKVVAQFEPANAFGRIQQGQEARLRLEGFPWTQYGVLKATVISVANEVRDGSVRVELRPDRDSRLPLQHGLPGSTEVKVEEISPAALVLRIAGQMLGPQRRAPAPQPAQQTAATKFEGSSQ